MGQLFICMVTPCLFVVQYASQPCGTRFSLIEHNSLEITGDDFLFSADNWILRKYVSNTVNVVFHFLLLFVVLYIYILPQKEDCARQVTYKYARSRK